jgi:aminoglycoside phosphotransferase (APT) family kinase protein
MPDLSGTLFDWGAPISVEALDRVLAGLAALHALPWSVPGVLDAGPWCPIPERVTLICRASLERPGPARDAVAGRILPGWDAFDRRAPAEARDLINRLGADPAPLLAALATEPTTLLHGDLKLANAGIAADGAIDIVDWQMVTAAPVAIELGWFLASNVSSLPLPPDEVLDRYWRIRGEDSSRQADLTILVGLLLRGWRKGYDAEAGVTLASGVPARDDLAWWCERALEAAGRLR